MTDYFLRSQGRPLDYLESLAIAAFSLELFPAFRILLRTEDFPPSSLSLEAAGDSGQTSNSPVDRKMLKFIDFH